jgi:hypothetical protein
VNGSLTGRRRAGACGCERKLRQALAVLGCEMLVLGWGTLGSCNCKSTMLVRAVVRAIFSAQAEQRDLMNAKKIIEERKDTALLRGARAKKEKQLSWSCLFAAAPTTPHLLAALWDCRNAPVSRYAALHSAQAPATEIQPS